MTHAAVRIEPCLFEIEGQTNVKLGPGEEALIHEDGSLKTCEPAGAHGVLDLPILNTILPENSLKGSVAGMGQDMHDAPTMLVHGRIQTKPFTSATYTLDDIQLAFDTYPDRPADIKTQIVLAS